MRRWAATLICGLALLPAAARADDVRRPQPAAFPRLAATLIGNPHDYDRPAYQREIARLDLAILGMYDGWNRGGTTPAQVVRRIKRLNPSILLGNYTIMTEASHDEADPATARLRAKLGAGVGPGGVGDWWAYDAAGRHTDWSGGDYGAWDTNLTLLTTPDRNGDRWPQWLAKSDHKRLLRGAGFDIWYSDNNFWQPRSDADWDRDGTSDPHDSARAREWWRNGQRAYYDAAKAIAPEMSLMVNADSDLDGSAFPPGADRFPQYRKVAHGAFMEHVMGKDWSVETWGGWNLAMRWYRGLKLNLSAPRMVIFDAWLPVTDDYQYLRYAFATCLMDDGYFSASTDYNQIVWFDEYDLAGRGSTKWLGEAIDAPQTAPWSKGVYRRRFANGMVLVNPKGNGRRTVQIEPGYRRFMGTQDPSVNDGSAARAVTLEDRDGVFLVKR